MEASEAKNEKKEFIKYLIPSMLSMIAVSCYSFVDTFVVGRAIGSLAVGAMGLCTPVLSTLFALGFLFGTGGGILYSVHMSRGNDKDARGVYTTSLTAGITIGLLISLFGNLFIYSLATFLGATDANMDLSIEYLRWIISLAPFMICDIILNSFMRNEGHPKVSMVATLTGTGLNIILDFVFVMGFNLGMGGAASATCLASVISVGINLFYAIKAHTNLIPYKVKSYFKVLFSILKLGLSSFILESAVAVITVIFVNVAGKYYSDAGVSAFSAIMTINLVVYSLINGVSQSMQPLVSLNYGKGDKNAMKRYLRYSLIASLAIGLIAFVITIIIPSNLASLFLTDKAETLDLASRGLRYHAVSFLCMSISIMYGIYYQAKEAVLHSLSILLGRSLAFPVACLFILMAIVSENCVWLAIPIGEALTMLMSIIFRLWELHKSK